MENSFPQYKSEFISTFKQLGRSRHYFEVFRDFVHMAAFSIHNSVCMNVDFESEYITIVGRHSKDDVNLISKLLSLTVLALESQYCDFLGQVFMELELGSARAGQFFTPYPVSKMMAQLTFGNSSEDLKKRPYITLNEPTSGAGGMVIAIAEAMLDAGNNPQEQLWVCCQVIDPVAAMMCYIQISILGIPGVVITGNTLALECRRIMYTPFHYLFDWKKRIEWWTAWEKFFKVISSLEPLEEPVVDELKEVESGDMQAVDFILEAVPRPVAPRSQRRRFPSSIVFTRSLERLSDEEQLNFDF